MSHFGTGKVVVDFNKIHPAKKRKVFAERSYNLLFEKFTADQCAVNTLKIYEEALSKQLSQYPQVEVVQLDSEWVQRLYAIMDIVRRAVVVLGLMLCVGVLLVVGNTIRLAIQNRRDEIVIVKLIGGTNGFIRRPFLYTGFWYGFIGGLIALVLVFISLLILSGPIENLAGLYQSNFALHTMDFGTIFTILVLSIALGLSGSWLAVGRVARSRSARTPSTRS